VIESRRRTAKGRLIADITAELRQLASIGPIEDLAHQHQPPEAILAQRKLEPAWAGRRSRRTRRRSLETRPSFLNQLPLSNPVPAPIDMIEASRGRCRHAPPLFTSIVPQRSIITIPASISL